MERILYLFGVVNLAPRVLELYPHELSGGMLQRVSIALSLVHLPELVIFDEATTALDVITQAQILDEVSRLQRELKLTSVTVTHDISVVARTCNRVAVMYAGRLVEAGDTATVLARPLHPYTEGLLRSFPSLAGQRQRIRGIPGSLPDLRCPVAGCIFASRCPDAFDLCRKEAPVPVLISQGPTPHVVACHKYGGGGE
jgi:peptide/nickel transport system ATP-binding protein